MVSSAARVSNKAILQSSWFFGSHGFAGRSPPLSRWIHIAPWQRFPHKGETAAGVRSSHRQAYEDLETNTSSFGGQVNSEEKVVFWGEAEIAMIHDRAIELGGLSGVRDRDLLASAVGNVELMHQFGESDVFKIAASLAFSLAMNHPFADGNKRTALFSAIVFLDANGYLVDAEKEQFDDLMVYLVSGKLSQEELAIHFQKAATKI